MFTMFWENVIVTENKNKKKEKQRERQWERKEKIQIGGQEKE